MCRRGAELAGFVNVAWDTGCEWLHVDFEDHLGPFYFGCCGLRPTNAGLIRLGADPSPIR